MNILKTTRIIIVLFTVLFSAFNIAYAAECETIRFRKGESSGTVRGIAPAEDIVCYKMTTGQGQTATLRVTAGENIIFSIKDLVDAQDSYTFATDKKTYTIIVGQLMRAIEEEPFTLFISIK